MIPGLRLDHVGYAVESIERYLADFLVPLFEPESVSSTVEDPLQRVRIAVVTLRGGHQIELIEPANRESPISRFLRQKRGGLYHCCYAVDDLAKAMRQFVDKGCVLISGPAPACALDNRKVVFLFTPHHDVIELVEERRPL